MNVRGVNVSRKVVITFDHDYYYFCLAASETAFCSSVIKKFLAPLIHVTECNFDEIFFAKSEKGQKVTMQMLNCMNSTLWTWSQRKHSDLVDFTSRCNCNHCELTTNICFLLDPPKKWENNAKSLSHTSSPCGSCYATNTNNGDYLEQALLSNDRPECFNVTLTNTVGNEYCDFFKESCNDHHRRSFHGTLTNQSGSREDCWRNSVISNNNSSTNYFNDRTLTTENPGATSVFLMGERRFTCASIC